ncbi:MAG: DNA polymerase III subunit beta [Chloroflexi bacterium]|nr:MAG: DNA polymerase III subunit beta [Chloroflexota bacterium]
MKLECLQENLAEGLSVVGRVVPNKSTLPVLSNVLLSTRDGELQLTANNLELSVAHRVPAAIGREGEITLPARLVADYVALLDHGQKVELELNPKTHKVHLACGRFEANIAGIAAEDFPPIPAVSGGPSFSIPAGLLKEAIDEVVFAAAPDDTRPVLAGALLKMGGTSLTLAAADGFRLAVRTVELPDGGPELQMIVPAKTLNEVGRLLGDASDDDQVAINTTPNGNQVYFAFGKTEITSRLIEGQFPDYQRIIPADSKTRVKVSTTDFLRATRAAQVFARDNSHIVRLECSPAKENADLALGSVLVKSTSAEMGDNEGNLDAVVDGDDTQIAFNGRYLRDALEAIETPEVLLQLTGPNLELSVAHRVPAAIGREGEITLPARLVADYVALLDHGQKVELELNP